MRFIFRADASREIGSGHVMRSSVLAEEAISRGYECIFIGKIVDLDWVKARVLKLGFSQVLATGDSFIADINSDVLILDSYTMPVSEPFISKNKWKLVMSICDEITPKYDVDIQLHPSLDNSKTRPSTPMVLSGADYILIRKGIVKTKRRYASGEKTKVLVIGGGSDPFGFVREISGVIRDMNTGLEVHQFSDEIVFDREESGFVTHPIGFELDSIAGDFDLVFTTASTSSFEFVAREIPIGIVCVVNNQKGYYEQLERLGYAAQIGTYNSDGNWDFNLARIKELLESLEKRESLKEAIRGVIDLNGAARVIDALVAFARVSKN